MHVVLRAYLELMRPANVVTAVSDVLAGYAVAGLANGGALPWLLAATACLYAGGVVLNDYFDRRLDASERPERPIPSGRVPPGRAAALGAGLLVAGVASASRATVAAALVAALIAVLIVLYDAWSKRHGVLGPVNMGLCRALNLILGIAAVPSALAGHWAIGLLALVYIGAVTLVSRGEVHGGKLGAAAGALISLAGVTAALAALAWTARDSGAWVALMLTAVLAWRVLPPFWAVYRDASPAQVRRAVRTGVLSLVILDAAIGAAYAGPLYGAVILATGVLAGMLARLFAVT